MTEEITNNQVSEAYPEPEFQEMIDAGVFYGRQKNKTYPRMKPYVFRAYNNIEVVNLEKTKENLEKALGFLKEKVRQGAGLLLVGTQPSASEKILELSGKLGYPSVVNRWLGGTLTNFRVISGRIDYYKRLRRESESGELEKYTKRERLKINEEIEHLKELFGSMENYNSLPGVLVVIDPIIHKTAVHEANKINIPVIAFANTDANPDILNYPVVGNTKSRQSVEWFLEKVGAAAAEAKAMAAGAAAEKETPKENQNG